MNEMELLHILENYPNSNYYLTGSRAWGLNENHSDYDYICGFKEYCNYIILLKDNDIKITEGTYHKSIYFTLNKKRINLFMLSDGKLKSWKLATETIKNILQIDKNIKEILSTKSRRIMYFEYLVTSNNLFYK